MILAVRRSPIAWLGLCLMLAVAGLAQALTLNLSGVSSEPTTNPAGDLSATMIFTVTNCGATCDVTLRVENNTDLNGSGVEYDINRIYFNASFAVFNSPDLTYVSATRSDTSVVTSGWVFNEEDAVDNPETHADGWGIFDFSLLDGAAPRPTRSCPVSGSISCSPRPTPQPTGNSTR